MDQLITGHEGLRLHVYTDTTGNLTIGYGWNLNDADSEDICNTFGLNLGPLIYGTENLTEAQALEVFNYQLNLVIQQARSVFPMFDNMPDAVQAVICDQIFNMGLPKFLGFVNEIADLKAGNYTQAAKDALDSEWAKQVPERAADDARLLEAA